MRRLRLYGHHGTAGSHGSRLPTVPMPGLWPAVNERSGGVLNRTSLPSDVIALVVFFRLRYRLTLGDLSEMLALRRIEASHEAVRDWETKLLPVMGEALRKRRHGTRRRSNVSWYVDETYLKVRGRWTTCIERLTGTGHWLMPC